jgi:hypothetical protein
MQRTEERRDSTERPQRVGDWIVMMPTHFRRLDTDDATQFTDGKRVVYMSALSVSRDGIATSAEELHRRTRPRDVELYELRDQDAFGYANVRREGPEPSLVATREADGSVLQCVINYSDDRDLEWALGVWRSVRRSVRDQDADRRSGPRVPPV